MRRVADLLVRDPTNVTFLADRLGARGLLERRKDPTDRRVTVPTVTSSGIELRRRLLEGAVGQSPFLRLTDVEQGELLHPLSKVNHPKGVDAEGK